LVNHKSHREAVEETFANELYISMCQVLQEISGRRLTSHKKILHKKCFMRGRFLAQRRKDAKRCRVAPVFLCVFAPLREKNCLCRSCDVTLIPFVQSHPAIRLGFAQKVAIQL
jgi:hypothetical protein